MGWKSHSKNPALRFLSSIDSNYAVLRPTSMTAKVWWVVRSIHSEGCWLIVHKRCRSQRLPHLAMPNILPWQAEALRSCCLGKCCFREITYFVKCREIVGRQWGSYFLLMNQQVSQRTKHIDIQWHFKWENWENGKVEAQFMWSEDNEVDFGTKHIPAPKLLIIELSTAIREGTLYSSMRPWNQIMDGATRRALL